MKLSKTLAVLLPIFIFTLDIIAQVPFKEAVVKGKLSNINEAVEISLKLPNRDGTIVATTKPDAKGNFVLKAPIIEPNLYRLWISETNASLIILYPGDEVVIQADASNIDLNSTIKGSNESVLLKNGLGRIRQFNQSMDSINKVYQANAASPDIDSLLKVLQAAYIKYDNARRDFINGFITANPQSLAGLAIIESLDMETEFNSYDLLDQGLSKAHPNNVFVKDFHTRVDAERKVAIGSMAPEISLADTAGNMFNLSSLRGKIVMIDFWASWCGPCRKENPNVVELYKKYKDKGFEILGVSLDRERSKWLQAIKTDGLVWKHVSDLLYWKSKPAQLYGVSSIPATFLVDRDGKIIGKKLRGPALEQKMAELFGF